MKSNLSSDALLNGYLTGEPFVHPLCLGNDVLLLEYTGGFFTEVVGKQMGELFQ